MLSWRDVIHRSSAQTSAEQLDHTAPKQTGGLSDLSIANLVDIERRAQDSGQRLAVPDPNAAVETKDGNDLSYQAWDAAIAGAGPPPPLVCIKSVSLQILDSDITNLPIDMPDVSPFGELSGIVQPIFLSPPAL